jgi:hypothetical protein
MKHWPAILAASAALLAAAPASAQSAFEDWESGPWQVYLDSDTCWLIYTVPEGELQVSVAKTDHDFYVGAKMQDWTFTVKSAPYPVRIGIGEKSYAVEGNGMHDPGVAAILDTPSPQVMPIFARAKRLSFSVEAQGRRVEVELDRTARDRFVACERSIGGAGSAPED